MNLNSEVLFVNSWSNNQFNDMVNTNRIQIQSNIPKHGNMLYNHNNIPLNQGYV